MKEKDASKYFIFFFVFALIALGVLVWPNQYNTESVTGSSHIQFEEKPERYAKTLENWIDEFFHIDGIIFPEGYCPEIAKELLENCVKKKLKVTEDFSTIGQQRVSSVLFGIEQEFVGALEMIQGKDLLKDEGVESGLNLWVEAIVRLPKFSRASEIEVSLLGATKDKFYVQRGNFSTPLLICGFTALPNGESECSCETGRRYEYINE